MAQALLLGLASCARDVSPGGAIVPPTGSFGQIGVPVASMQERKFQGVVRQRYDFSCGSAALATLLRYHYADGVDEEAVFRGMWSEGDRAQIRKLGFSLLDMKRYLMSRGMKADGYRVTLDQIGKAATPGIALISVRSYRHFVVLEGVSPSEVLLGDPASGAQVLPRAKFEAAWNGVIFVIDSGAPSKNPAFNLAGQWAAYGRAPIGDRFVQPLSQQALALTAPFYQDF